MNLSIVIETLQVIWHFYYFIELLIVGLYVPTLVSLLADPENSQGLSPARSTVHQCALQQLMKIGPQYPQEFRTVVGRNLRLKSRLESCIRAAQMGLDSNRDNSLESESRTNTRSSPTIKLKTDFSNFTGWRLEMYFVWCSCIGLVSELALTSYC